MLTIDFLPSVFEEQQTGQDRTKRLDRSNRKSQISGTHKLRLQYTQVPGLGVIPREWNGCPNRCAYVSIDELEGCGGWKVRMWTQHG